MNQNMLSDCEQMVMKSIWDAETEMGVQEITSNVNAKYARDWKLQTVSTFLARLVKKGYITMYRKGRTFFYQPLINEKDYRRDVIKEHIDFWNAGKVVDFAHSICESVDFSDVEKKAIKDMVAGI